jgi:hypothetical protein
VRDPCGCGTCTGAGQEGDLAEERVPANRCDEALRSGGRGWDRRRGWGRGRRWLGRYVRNRGYGRSGTHLSVLEKGNWAGRRVSDQPVPDEAAVAAAAEVEDKVIDDEGSGGQSPIAHEAAVEPAHEPAAGVDRLHAVIVGTGATLLDRRFSGQGHFRGRGVFSTTPISSGSIG